MSGPTSSSPVGAVRRLALLVGAATTGALLGFGVRERAPLVVLADAGQRLRGVPAFVAPDRGFGYDVLLGLAQHALLVVVWSAIVVALTQRVGRAAVRAAVAVTVGIAIVVIDVLPLPAALHVAGGALGGAQRVLFALVLAAALAFGMRLAPYVPVERHAR